MGKLGYWRAGRNWGVLALAGLAGVVLAVVVASSTQAQGEVINPFAGQWSTTLSGGVTGSVSFSVISESQGISDIEAMGGQPCGAPTTYYHGDYTDTGPSAGTMTICTETAGHAVGRFVNSNTDLTYPGGDLDITLNSAQNAFSGFYIFDDPDYGGMEYPYNGTFVQHFPGDGCCTTTTTTTGTTTTTPPPSGLSPPTTFCPTSGHAPSAAATPPCEDSFAMTPQEKKQAAAIRDVFAQIFIVTCVLGDEYGASLAQCQTVTALLVGSVLMVKDPPDSNFQQVALPTAPVSPSPGRCPKGLSRHTCARLKAASLKYAAAIGTTQSLATAYAITLDRFSGALKANSPRGAFLQDAVSKVYGGALAVAFSSQDAAGRALAQQIRSAHLNRHLKGKHAASQARHHIPNSVLSTLVSKGLATSQSQARSLIVSQLGHVPGSLDLAGALGAQTSAGALTAQYQTITLRGLAAIVNALAAQGTISQSAGQALIADLAQAQAVCSNSTQLAAAMSKFDSDASAQTPPTPANLLRFGAEPLASGNATAAACA